MPMLDIQRRHAEVFRIRFGDRDGNRPRKLTDSIRITSPNASVCQAFAEVYGGEVRPWEAQHEVYLPTTELAIVVLPGQSVQQWWELYRESVCERRCDGYTEQLSGDPCKCPSDITARMGVKKGACRPMTRVSVLCPDVEVVGAGSLVTHGLVAAETLPQSIAVAEAALSRGIMVPAVLRVMQHKGRTHYIVPQIEITGVSLPALMAGDVPPAVNRVTGEIIAPTVAAIEPPKPAEDRAIAAPPPAEDRSAKWQARMARQAANAAAVHEREPEQVAPIPAPAADPVAQHAAEVGKTSSEPKPRRGSAAKPGGGTGNGQERGEDGNQPSDSRVAEVSEAAAPAPPAKRKGPMLTVCAALGIKPHEGWVYLVKEHREEFGDLRMIRFFEELDGDRAQRAEKLLTNQFDKTEVPA